MTSDYYLHKIFRLWKPSLNLELPGTHFNQQNIEEVTLWKFRTYLLRRSNGFYFCSLWTSRPSSKKSWKWKRETLSHSAVSDSLRLLFHGTSQARILEWVTIPFSRGSSRPGIKPGSPAFQADSLPSEAQGSPKKSYYLSEAPCRETRGRTTWRPQREEEVLM